MNARKAQPFAIAMRLVPIHQVHSFVSVKMALRGMEQRALVSTVRATP